MNIPEIAKCPLCGNKASIMGGGVLIDLHVGCDNCGLILEVTWDDLPKEQQELLRRKERTDEEWEAARKGLAEIAVSRWNRRQPTPEAATDPRCITQTINLPPPVLTDSMCEAFANALGYHLNEITEDDDLPYDKNYLQAVWRDIWAAHPPKPEPTVAAAEACKCGKMPSHIYEDKYGDWRIHR